MYQINYIECKGVRVPAAWTVEQLREALAKRSIRFSTYDEREIMTVFGDAILLKEKLEQEIESLQIQIANLNEKRKTLVICSFCKTPLIATPSPIEAKRRGRPRQEAKVAVTK